MTTTEQPAAKTKLTTTERATTTEQPSSTTTTTGKLTATELTTTTEQTTKTEQTTTTKQTITINNKMHFVAGIFNSCAWLKSITQDSIHLHFHLIFYQVGRTEA